MGFLKILIFLSLISIIINVGLHYEIINEAISAKEEAEKYVDNHCGALEQENYVLIGNDTNVFEWGDIGE